MRRDNELCSLMSNWPCCALIKRPLHEILGGVPRLHASAYEHPPRIVDTVRYLSNIDRYHNNIDFIVGID